MPRLFTALEIPPEIVAELALFRGGLGSGARWVEPENYHLTLRFIGDIDGALARDIDATLAEAEPHGPVRVTFERLDTFGGARPRALVARAAPAPDLLRLAAEHERLIRRAGAEPETRKFTPHVTLARFRGVRPAEAAAFLARTGPLAGLTFTAARAVLFSARDGTGGGPYRPEAVYPLADVQAGTV